MHVHVCVNAGTSMQVTEPPLLKSTALDVSPVLQCYLEHVLTKLFSLGLELTLCSQQVFILQSAFDAAGIKVVSPG